MTSTPEPNGNQSPWGIVSYIAKKDGVIGLFLIILCYFIWTDSKADREDRIRAESAYKVVVDSLVSSHRREAVVVTQATEAIRNSTAAIDNTRKALMFVERHHHRSVMEN